MAVPQLTYINHRRTRNNAAEILKLNLELPPIIVAVLTLRSDLTDLQTAFDALVFDVSQYEERIVTLETTTSELENSLETLQIQVDSLSSSLDALNDLVETNIANILFNYNSISSLTDRVNQIRIDIDDNTADIISINQTLISLTNKLDDVETNIDLLDDRVDANATAINNLDVSRQFSVVSFNPTGFDGYYTYQIQDPDVSRNLVSLCLRVNETEGWFLHGNSTNFYLKWFLNGDTSLSTMFKMQQGGSIFFYKNVIGSGNISSNTYSLNDIGDRVITAEAKLTLLDPSKQFSEVGPLIPTSYGYFYTITNPAIDVGEVGLYFKTKFIYDWQVDYFFTIFGPNFYFIGRSADDPNNFISIITTFWTQQRLNISFSISCEKDISSNLYTLNTIGEDVDFLKTDVETLETKVETLEIKVATLEDEIQLDTSNVFTVENTEHEIYRVGHLVESLGVTSNLNGDSGVVVDSTRCFTNVRLLRTAREFLGVITAFDDDYITYRTCGCCLVLMTRIVPPSDGNTLIPFVDGDLNYAQMADAAHMMPALMDNYIVGKIINSAPIIDASLAVYEDVDYQFVSVFLK